MPAPVCHELVMLCFSSFQHTKGSFTWKLPHAYFGKRAVIRKCMIGIIPGKVIQDY